MSKLLTACMVDDCLHDPVLAAKVILNIELTPYQELRLWGMWKKKFMIDSSGFGTGKSFVLAICCGLRAVLMEERVAGIISRTFNQGHLIYSYFDKWANRSATFRSQIAELNSVEIDSVHSSTAWQMRFRNESLIRTIPPDFQKEAARVASEDWNDGYFDEWTKYPNYLAFWRNIWTRVRKPINKKYDVTNPIFDRHFYMSGTARYQWHPCYSQIESYADQIKKGSSKHEVQSWNYTHTPKEMLQLIELDGIKQLENSLSRDLVQQEIYGIWVRDSLGFYSFKDTSDARTTDCPVLIGR